VIELEGMVVDSSGILRLKIDDDDSRYAVVIRDGAAFMILKLSRKVCIYGRTKI